MVYPHQVKMDVLYVHVSTACMYADQEVHSMYNIALSEGIPSQACILYVTLRPVSHLYTNVITIGHGDFVSLTLDAFLLLPTVCA